MSNESYGVMDTFRLFGNKTVGAHPNPYYNYTQVFTPRRLKELFKWCEFLFYNSPHIFASLRKFGEYPITTITYDTTNETLKNKHSYLLEKVLKARELLIMATLDKYVYGNTFMSMYQPFIRYLKCPRCNTQTNIKNILYSVNMRDLTFSYRCESCKNQVKAGAKDIIDKKLMLSRKVNFIRWDPKLMDIDFNEITGESTYYFTIPPTLVQKLNSGHKTLIDSLPLGFLRAVQANKKFKFAEGAIFHLKMCGPAGVNPQWGLPPLLSVLQMFHYTAILRKANEAIALDHLTPFRVIHPAQSSGNADPMVNISLQKWQDSIQYHMKQWRMDPLHVMFAPVPIAMTQVGGEGRALLTLGEVQEAEKSIVSALGVPIEFVYGGLTGKGMEATLRLIENQLETHINDLLDLLQWVDDKSSKFLGWEPCQVGMTKFTMVDDEVTKQVVLQMWQQGLQGGERIVSNATVAEMYDIDTMKEKTKIKQEMLDSVRDQQELQKEIEAIQNNMAQQVQQEASQGPQKYNQQQIIAEADAFIQQLMQMDEGMKRNQLHQLEMEDLIMYSVVVQRMEQQQLNMKQQAKTQAGGAA